MRQMLLQRIGYITFPSVYEVKSLELIDSSDYIFSNFKTDHYFKVGDTITVIEGGSEKGSTIISITAADTITIRGQGQLDTNASFTIRRNILKAILMQLKSTNNYSANVQNVYVGSIQSRTKQEKLLVSSPSIPFTMLNP